MAAVSESLGAAHQGQAVKVADDPNRGFSSERDSYPYKQVYTVSLASILCI